MASTSLPLAIIAQILFDYPIIHRVYIVSFIEPVDKATSFQIPVVRMNSLKLRVKLRDIHKPVRGYGIKYFIRKR